MNLIYSALVCINLAAPQQDFYSVFNDFLIQDSSYRNHYSNVVIQQTTERIVPDYRKYRSDFIEEFKKYHIDTLIIDKIFACSDTVEIEQSKIHSKVSVIKNYQFPMTILTRHYFYVSKNFRIRIPIFRETPYKEQERLKKATTVYSFSVPYYLREDLCVIQISRSSGVTYGDSCYYIMKQTQNGWIIVDSFQCKLS